MSPIYSGGFHVCASSLATLIRNLDQTLTGHVIIFPRNNPKLVWATNGYMYKKESSVSPGCKWVGDNKSRLHTVLSANQSAEASRITSLWHLRKQMGARKTLPQNPAWRWPILPAWAGKPSLQWSPECEAWVFSNLNIAKILSEQFPNVIRKYFWWFDFFTWHKEK